MECIILVSFLFSIFFFFFFRLHLSSKGKSREETTEGLDFENAFRYLGLDPELRFGRVSHREKNNVSKTGKVSFSFLLRILSCSNWIKQAKS